MITIIIIIRVVALMLYIARKSRAMPVRNDLSILTDSIRSIQEIIKVVASLRRGLVDCPESPIQMVDQNEGLNFTVHVVGRRGW
jgi:hypothetical protein